MGIETADMLVNEICQATCAIAAPVAAGFTVSGREQITTPEKRLAEAGTARVALRKRAGLLL
ncbi:hypothetical protein [Ensifer sp. LCM 4579]|uniref:hypothetical protein n=1 Tax=Ensifer sp. LCM 4579 TaxID=1848292 RepID=UPI0008D9FEFD|nr:hypothetical protein [Ensifer sp. LCM 4579]OHV75284.1 hypothetical protein LCM4579_28180 [Ensifer sp. LCM 4579]